MRELPTFTALEWFDRSSEIRPFKIAMVHLDKDRDSNGIAELSRSNVIVDGKEWRCAGVERFMHGEPWHAGEKVGLALFEVSLTGVPALSHHAGHR